MRARFVDQGHVGLAATPELVAQAGREFEPAGAAANNDNAMRSGDALGRTRLAGVRCTIHCSPPSTAVEAARKTRRRPRADDISLANRIAVPECRTIPIHIKVEGF